MIPATLQHKLVRALRAEEQGAIVGALRAIRGRAAGRFTTFAEDTMTATDTTTVSVPLDLAAEILDALSTGEPDARQRVGAELQALLDAGTPPPEPAPEEELPTVPMSERHRVAKFSDRPGAGPRDRDLNARILATGQNPGNFRGYPHAVVEQALAAVEAKQRRR